MSAITIAGGIYHERCVWPQWDQIYGSGGRAAAALVGHVDQITLRGYAQEEIASQFRVLSEAYGFTFDPIKASQAISFEYFHCLSVPIIRPFRLHIQRCAAFTAKAPVVLRFGMMEGTVVVDADCCIYDPQSAFYPEGFHDNGSQARRLAIVANRGEVIAMGKNTDPIASAQALLKTSNAEAVIVKSGPEGAFVVEQTGVNHIPAYQTHAVWTIGSGDVFAAFFAARWGIHGDSATRAAELASKAVAEYAESMALPTPSVDQLDAGTRVPGRVVPGRVYLASPFFTLGQRWVVDEARRCLQELGLDVFSPVHDVGPGPADAVAPADLAALEASDVVFAILDHLDSGTLFEVGYARAKGKPVYALAQTVSEEDLKMVSGSGCAIFCDFVTALHHVAWRA